ncbi:MAG: apolipoprotein N-acyltransferase, partial [Gallionella sp.]|nr:apolipoprotein N-acyltransferase [Gallionella sp.]
MGIFSKNFGVALLSGAMCVFGFAPFGIYAIPLLALAVLFSLWLRAGSARAAAWLGFAFGLGLFGAGIGWIYIAMHEYGGMPMLLALLATLLFAAFWALLPALAGYMQARFFVANWLRLALAMPAVWALLEW